jgi:uncharacterized PurR-regulated membrane protein YhhQ (DUF165 family)
MRAGKILCRHEGLKVWRDPRQFCAIAIVLRTMILQILRDKPTKLFVGLAAFFVANALIAECIGTKLFSLPRVFGMEPETFTLFGQEGLSYVLTCGVLLWPLEFVMTDVVNEFYGPKAVRRISLTRWY